MKIFAYIFLAVTFVCADVAQAQISQPKTGAYDHRVRLSEIVEGKNFTNFSSIYKEDEVLSWRIFVPTNYRPSHPPGVLVYISPTRSGTPPWDWLPVLERQNMIYISAHQAGNRVPVNRRISNAVVGLTLIRSLYKTDNARAFVSGFSGGARTSTLIVELLPNIFSGALFIGGAYEWRGERSDIKSRLRDGAYVFLTGTRDHAHKESHRTYWQYRKAGVERVKLMIVKNLGHHLPKGTDFEEALVFLSTLEKTKQETKH